MAPVEHDGNGKPRPGAGRRFAAVVGVVAIVALAYLGVTLVQVIAAAEGNSRGAAQAIIVLGAAQYDGRPSPVLESRLTHAIELYLEGVAPVLVVTGGAQPGDRSREATASANYLRARDVPESAIRREVDGRSTWEQLRASARFLAEEGIDEVVLVSDPLHSKRLALTAAEIGLLASVSPTPDSAFTGGARARMALRETVAVAAGRLIGFRRLTALSEVTG